MPNMEDDWYNTPPTLEETAKARAELRAIIAEEAAAETKTPGKVPMRGGTLLEALNIVNGERQDAYGDPENSFPVIAALWNAYLAPRFASGVMAITPHDAAVMLALLKVGRIAYNPAHRDSHVDAAAYMALAYDLVEEQAKEGQA